MRGKRKCTSHRGCLVRVFEGHCRLGRLIGGNGLYFWEGALSIGMVNREGWGDKNLEDQIFVICDEPRRSAPLANVTHFVLVAKVWILSPLYAIYHIYVSGSTDRQRHEAFPS